jgi:hypothetical protein
MLQLCIAQPAVSEGGAKLVLRDSFPRVEGSDLVVVTILENQGYEDADVELELGNSQASKTMSQTIPAMSRQEIYFRMPNFSYSTYTLKITGPGIDYSATILPQAAETGGSGNNFANGQGGLYESDAKQIVQTASIIVAAIGIAAVAVFLLKDLLR